MLKSFRTFQLAKQFYKSIQLLKLPAHLNDQLQRAASSTALNLAEGSGKPTKRDQLKFFYIALASHRECQAALQLAGIVELDREADCLAAHLFRLCKGCAAR